MERGLDKVDAGPLGGYLEASGVWSSAAGVAARAELGFHPSRNVSVFGAGEVSPVGSSAGAGVRIRF